MHVLCARYHGGEEDLGRIREACQLTPSDVTNVRHLLGWNNVGNSKGDRNDRAMRKKTRNIQLLVDVKFGQLLMKPGAA